MKRSRLSRKGSRARPSRLKPFDYGEDVRGDMALFVPITLRLDDKALIEKLKSLRGKSQGLVLKQNPDGTFTKSPASDYDAVFFRVIDEKGNQLHSHGWIRYNKETGRAEITQWG